jgi:apolipoprotein N-acyltransferase
MYSLYPIISGVLLGLAFPKFSFWWLAWVALVPFFIALNNARSMKESCAYSFSFGLVFFGINLFWITSLFRFAGWWAVAAWGALALFQALFIILFSTLYSLLSTSKLNSYYLILNPILWVSIEFLRSLGPFGVTAGGLGYSQASFLPLIQIASFSGVYGVSFLVVFLNAALASLLPSPADAKPSPLSQPLDSARGERERVEANRDRKTAVTWLVISVLLVIVATVYGNITLIRHSSFVIRNFPKLALIQPNIDQMDKLNPVKIPEIFAIHEDMSRQAAKEKPEIIIWPETAIFTYILRDPVYFPKLKQLVVDTGAWFIIGTPHYEGNRIFNSMVSLDPRSGPVSRFDKEQLVPFGEYLPFRALLLPLLKQTGYFSQDFDFGEWAGPLLAGKYQIAPAICFESTFPGLIRRRVNGKTDFILTITNDSWFNDSAAPYEHLENGILRAIENRKYFVQVGNTGISAVIDPYGRVLKRTKLNERAVLVL